MTTRQVHDVKLSTTRPEQTTLLPPMSSTGLITVTKTVVIIQSSNTGVSWIKLVHFLLLTLKVMMIAVYLLLFKVVVIAGVQR